MAFFKQENLYTVKLHLFVRKSASYEIENCDLLKSSQISLLLTKNLKESYYNMADSFIKNKIWLKGWNFFLFLNRKFSDFKKTSFRYYRFSVAINVFLWGCG